MRTFVVDEPRSQALRALNYSPAVERIRQVGSSSARPLRSIVRDFGPAYGTVFTRLDCHTDHGIELITQADMFSAEPSGRMIRLDSMRQPEWHLVTRGQVLIAGAGTLGENELYGRSILADGRLVGKYVGPDSMSLHFDDPKDDFSLFTYAWLASPTGIQAIRSTSYGTKILRFREDALSSLPVPIAQAEIVAKVASLIRRCSSERDRYQQALHAARASRPPGVEDFRSGSGYRPRVVIWSDRLPSIRAWNFASMGGYLQKLRQSWATTLRDWLRPEGLFKGGRVARIPCEKPFGVDLLSQRDVFAIRPAPRRIQAPCPSLEVGADYLLVASRGQMNEGALFGRVERGAHLPKGAAISEDILRMVPREGLGPALFSFLGSSLGLELLRTSAYGTSIPGMREDLLLDLPMPPPEGAWVEEASQHAEAASQARVRSSSAETEAIRIIEQEVLPQWLA